MLSRNSEDALPRVRISEVLHPAMLLAFPGGASLLQHGNRPALQAPDRWSGFPGHQHRIVLRERIPQPRGGSRLSADGIKIGVL